MMTHDMSSLILYDVIYVDRDILRKSIVHSCVSRYLNEEFNIYAGYVAYFHLSAS